MARQIIIEDAGVARPARPAARPRSRALDLQDWLLLMGILFFEIAARLLGGWPAALIVAGVFCLGFAFLIERRQAKYGSKTTAHGNPEP